MGQQQGSLLPQPEAPPEDPLFPNSMLYSMDKKKVKLEDFELLKVIGKGNFAKVMQVRKKDTGKIYAMKILSKARLKKSNQVEHIKTERIVLQHIDHPFLVRLHYAFQSDEKLYMVMDFVNGGELFFHLRRDKRFPEQRAKFYAAELFLALEHLHKHSVVYRDLKPENVLMDREGHIKLTDFGLSKILTKTERTNTFCGTPEYLAPEILLQKGHGKPVDWWSYGTLLYEMLVGIPPFYSANVQEMYDKILHGELYLPDEIMSVQAQDLLARLLERDPKKRLGCGPKGSAEIRNHPFFKDINWNDIYNQRVPVPYIPNVKSDLDTSYFDEEFTKQPAQDSVGDEGNRLNEGEQKVFEGFTFTGSGKLTHELGTQLGSSNQSTGVTPQSPQYFVTYQNYTQPYQYTQQPLPQHYQQPYVVYDQSHYANYGNVYQQTIYHQSLYPQQPYGQTQKVFYQQPSYKHYQHVNQYLYK